VTFIGAKLDEAVTLYWFFLGLPTRLLDDFLATAGFLAVTRLLFLAAAPFFETGFFFSTSGVPWTAFPRRDVGISTTGAAIDFLLLILTFFFGDGSAAVALPDSADCFRELGFRLLDGRVTGAGAGASGAADSVPTKIEESD
jgi:hypothetical protein